MTVPIGEITYNECCGDQKPGATLAELFAGIVRCQNCLKYLEIKKIEGLVSPREPTQDWKERFEKLFPVILSPIYSKDGNVGIIEDARSIKSNMIQTQEAVEQFFAQEISAAEKLAKQAGHREVIAEIETRINKLFQQGDTVANSVVFLTQSVLLQELKAKFTP